MIALALMLWVVGIGATYEAARPWFPHAPAWLYLLAWPALLVVAWICVLVTALEDLE